MTEKKKDVKYGQRERKKINGRKREMRGEGGGEKKEKG